MFDARIKKRFDRLALSYMPRGTILDVACGAGRFMSPRSRENNRYGQQGECAELSVKSILQYNPPRRNNALPRTR